MSTRIGVRLASFDGGGPRCISQLGIMQTIMHRLRFELHPDEPERVMLPSEHFDMIGGSDTGGLIAIMLTKLRMSVEDATEEFCTIFDVVYKEESLSPTERSVRLRSCMEDFLARKRVPTDLKLVEELVEGTCAGFVLATPRANIGHTVHLRTYPVRTEPSSAITIIDAVLAACSSQPKFAPHSVGVQHKRQEYVGAGPSANNPIRDVITEAHLLFGGDSSVATLLSLGTGNLGVMALPAVDHAVMPLGLLQNVLMDCEKRAEETEQQIGNLGIYFRFSVEQGMQGSLSAHANDLSWMAAQTDAYLAGSHVSGRVDATVTSLASKIGLITLNHLTTVYKASPPLATHYIRRVKPWKQLVRGVTSDTIGQKIFIVAGMAGCGKSQLVTDLAHEFNPARDSRFEHVFFLDGSSETSIQSDLIAHVRTTMSGSPQIDFPSALNFFQNPANSKWLVICDNVDDVRIDLRPLLPRCNHGVIVVTTRNQLLRKLASQPNFHIILDVMSTEESVEVILRCAGCQSFSDEEKGAAVPIADKLGNLPVALTQAGCYMFDTGYSCGEYLELLSDHLAELMEKPSGDRHNRSAYAAFDLTYGRLTPETQSLIHLLSLFHFANFPMAMISHAAKNLFRDDPFLLQQRGPEFESAIQILKDIFLPDGKWSTLTLPNLTGVFQNYSLATVTSNRITHLLRVHPLMHEWAFDRLAPERRPTFQEAACRLLVCCTGLDSRYLHPYLIPHINAMMARPGAESIHMNNRVAFAKVLWSVGLLQVPQRILLPIYHTLCREGGTQALRVATVALELAKTYDDTELDQMEKYEREAISIRETLLGSHHIDTLEATIQLSYTLSRQGRPEEARELGEKTLDELRLHSSPDHPIVLEALSALAWIYIQQESFSEAETLQRRLVEEQTMRLGESHLETLDAMYSLASTYNEQGHHTKAEALQVKVLEGRMAQLGEAHLETFNAMNNLSLTYYYQSRYSEAEPLQLKLLEMCPRIGGDESRRMATCAHNLALTYAAVGRRSEAKELLMTAEKIGRNLLGVGNPYYKVTVEFLERINASSEAVSPV